MIAASFSYFLELLLEKNKFQFKKYRKISFIKELIKLSYLYCSCRKVVEKSNEENLKRKKKTFSKKTRKPGNPKKKKKKKKSQNSWKALRLMCTYLVRICSKSCFLYGFEFSVLSDQ